jgi:hypothetical protein
MTGISFTNKNIVGVFGLENMVLHCCRASKRDARNRKRMYALDQEHDR